MIAQIEDALINAVKGAQGLGYSLRTVASYGGEFDSDLLTVVNAFPAVWVSFAGHGQPKRLGEKKWRVPVSFSVLAGARNVRGEVATRRGGAFGEVGSYQMLEDLQALFLGQDFGLAITPFTPGRVHSLFNGKLREMLLSVYAQEWHTDYILTQPEPAAVDLLKIGMDYYLQPDDGTADASDLVSLS